MKGGGVQRGGITAALMAALADLAAQSFVPPNALPARGMFVGRPGGRSGPGPRNPAGSKLLRRIAKHNTGRRVDYHEALRMYARMPGETLRTNPYPKPSRGDDEQWKAAVADAVAAGAGYLRERIDRDVLESVTVRPQA